MESQKYISQHNILLSSYADKVQICFLEKPFNEL